MFNDKLSDHRCTQLLRQLARTRDPFHCAHGRPSMTVLRVLEDD
jgi:DNA mismatch repair protein MLH3